MEPIGSSRACTMISVFDPDALALEAPLETAARIRAFAGAG